MTIAGLGFWPVRPDSGIAVSEDKVMNANRPIVTTAAAWLKQNVQPGKAVVSTHLSKRETSVTMAVPLPLENGDWMTRIKFERRYEAMPHLKKAELIEGKI